MKKKLFPRLIVLMLLIVAGSCQSRMIVGHPHPGSSTKGLPPGQAKKVYGHQSAKAFAPGQQKKALPYQSDDNKHKKGKKKK